jgi:hypothetical protein
MSRRDAGDLLPVLLLAVGEARIGDGVLAVVRKRLASDVPAGSSNR